MSRIEIEDEAWKRILADDRLRRARSRLSFHELRLIVQYVRDSGSRPSGENPERSGGVDADSPAERPAEQASPNTNMNGTQE
jgi:hypothetical protein